MPPPFFFTSQLGLTDAAYQHVRHKFDVKTLLVMLDTRNASHADLVYYYNCSNILPDLAHDDQINFKTYQIFKPGHGHLTPARAITADRSRMATANQHTEIQRFEKPTDYISVQRGTSDRLRQVVAERTCVDQILRNVWRLNTLACRDDGIVLEFGHEPSRRKHWADC